MIVKLRDVWSLHRYVLAVTINIVLIYYFTLKAEYSFETIILMISLRIPLNMLIYYILSKLPMK